MKHFTEICRRVLGKDRSIRFVGLANYLGTLEASSYRKGLAPLMSKEETQQYALQATTRALMRETFEPKVGRLRYAVGTYEKLIRATVPIHTEKNGTYYILLSFDVGADAAHIIEQKVVPYIRHSALKEPVE